MTLEEVPDELVQAAADVLQQNGLWGAWEREQTEEEAREILADVLPLHEKRLQAGSRATTSSRSRITVVVTQYPQNFKHWCMAQKRNPNDQTIIRITDVHSARHKLQGIADDFDLVVLSEVPHHNEVMALISHRMSTARREEPPQ